MLVAMDGDKLVGTAGIGEKYGKTWYANGRYAYECFASVLPEYAGKGIYKMLEIKRETKAKEDGYDVLIGDTHSKNSHRIEIALKNGFRLVHFFRAASKDHYNVVIAKWLNGCPYSSFYCRMKFHISKLKSLMRFPLKK
jgi:GNAT superfamily N-acetyltransferase